MMGRSGVPEYGSGIGRKYGGESPMNLTSKGGRWVPAIPLKAPIDVRWHCHHEWTPHVYDQGWDAWNYFDCTRCGVGIEAGVQPEDGPWPVRSWIARHVWRRAR